jgi:hypothetical protein
MRGAAGQGFDALFVLDGIHAAELGLDNETLGPAQRARVMCELAARVDGLSCVGVLQKLHW